MSGSYLTGLGDAVAVPVPSTMPPEYLTAITKLNTHRAVWPFIEAGAPPLDGLNAFLVKYATLLGSGTPINTLSRAYQEWIPALTNAGDTTGAATMRANLRSAGINANYMADFIVRLRQTKDPAYAASKWGTKTTEWDRGYLVDVRFNEASLPLLREIVGERGWLDRKVIWEETGQARLTYRQHTRYQMALWWQAIEQAAANVQLALKGFQMRQEGVPAPEPPPAAPINPTPAKPEGTGTGVAPAVLGIALAGAIAWWYTSRSRVKSL
jgi:hypothetical protein